MDSINQTVHDILNDGDLNQFNEHLYGLNDRRPLDDKGDPIPIPIAPTPYDEGLDKYEQFEKCKTCLHDCRSPNPLMSVELETVKQEMKSATVLKHFKRPDYFASKDINEYLKQPIWCWLPHLLLNVLGQNLNSLICWNKNCSGKISMLGTLEHRGVEGLKSNGFIVFCVYKCDKCKTNSQKSSLDIPCMHLMGFPQFICRQCPVLALHKSAVTQELLEFILTVATSEWGMNQATEKIRKFRTADYALRARCFMELQKKLAGPRTGI